jgi:hypothetical protein
MKRAVKNIFGEEKSNHIPLDMMRTWVSLKFAIQSILWQAMHQHW